MNVINDDAIEMSILAFVTDGLVWKNREIHVETIDDEQEHKTHLAISMKVPIVVAKSTFPITRQIMVLPPGAFSNDYL